MLQTRHVQNILRDPRVSLAIYSYPGPPGGNLGLQIRGKAERLGEDSPAHGWQTLGVIPEEVWCFDSRVYGGDRRLVDISELRLS
jgi:Pyridoxamine 5'-phosphate oxidase